MAGLLGAWARGRGRRQAGLLLVLAIAALPRLIDLDRPGLTYDELYDIDDSRRFCAGGSLLQPISDGYLNGQAPFAAACAAYAAFGDGDVTARGLAVLAGLATVGATFLLARRFYRTPWALAAALLLGLAPFFVSASRLAFSHGHVFGAPWLVLALWAALASRVRLGAARAAAGVGLLAGFAAGNDLLAVPWAASLAGLALWRLRRVRLPLRARWLTLFGLAWSAGLGLASPMYLAHPFEAARDVAARVAWWDAQAGHLWLGAEVPSLPGYYYPLVLLVKVVPPVLWLALFALRRPAPATRVCALLAWPLLLLSFKEWKSPFYLVPYLPLLYVVAGDALRRLAGAGSARRRWLAVAVAALVAGVQGRSLADTHPDYLMTGIRYDHRLYGDFAGPAVSHGQWVPEALEMVRSDAGRNDAVLLVPLGYAPRQVEIYAERLGLEQVHTPDHLRRGLHPRRVEYLVVAQDVYAHAEGRELNRALLRLVEGGCFRLLGEVRSAGFPMARVWKRFVPGRPGEPTGCSESGAAPPGAPAGTPATVPPARPRSPGTD